MEMTFVKFPTANVVAVAAIALAGLTGSDAMATMITYETRVTDQGVNASDYLASWNAQTSTINSTDLGAFTDVTAPGAGYHSHLRVEFTVDASTAGSDWAFQIAPDAGFGGAMYLNGSLADVSSEDLWWGYNWGNSSELLAATSLALGIGSHVLDVYWAEGCCNGGQSGRFSIDGGQDWMTLSVGNLDTMSVPEPGTLMLLAVGLFALRSSFCRSPVPATAAGRRS